MSEVLGKKETCVEKAYRLGTIRDEGKGLFNIERQRLQWNISTANPNYEMNHARKNMEYIYMGRFPAYSPFEQILSRVRFHHEIRMINEIHH